MKTAALVRDNLIENYKSLINIQNLGKMDGLCLNGKVKKCFPIVKNVA